MLLDLQVKNALFSRSADAFFLVVFHTCRWCCKREWGGRCSIAWYGEIRAVGFIYLFFFLVFPSCLYHKKGSGGLRGALMNRWRMQSPVHDPQRPTVLLPKSKYPCNMSTSYSLHCWSARSLFYFVPGSLKGHAANKQTCTILLHPVSGERTKSLAICAGVIKQRSLAGSQRTGGGCRMLWAGGTDAGFACLGHNIALEKGLGMWKCRLSPWVQVCPIPSSCSELSCGFQSSRLSWERAKMVLDKGVLLTEK